MDPHSHNAPLSATDAAVLTHWLGEVDADFPAIAEDCALDIGLLRCARAGDFSPLLTDRVATRELATGCLENADMAAAEGRADAAALYRRVAHVLMRGML